MANGENKKPETLKVLTTIVGSQYAHIVGVTVTDNDVTLDFVYKHPREDVKEGQAVARITLPRSTAERLPEVMIDTMKKHDADKKGKKNA